MRKRRNGGDFVHVLVFECVECGCPVPSAITSDAKNIEEVDVRKLKLQCHNCTWSGTSDGFAARRHWVDEWGLRATNEDKSRERTEEQQGKEQQ
jgi:hypothetical protein